MGRRQNKGLMLAPHLLAHDPCAVRTVTDSNHRGVVDQMWYLLGVMLVSRRKPDRAEPTGWAAAGMELKPVMPALPVASEVGYSFRYLVPVSSDEPADFEHGRVHEANGRVLVEYLVEHEVHSR